MPEQPQFVPGSIPEVGDPKLRAAVKIAIWQRQNLYLEHIGSDRRIFSEEVDPKRSPTHHRGPRETHFQKSSWASSISIRGAFGVNSGGAHYRTSCFNSLYGFTFSGILQFNIAEFAADQL